MDVFRHVIKEAVIGELAQAHGHSDRGLAGKKRTQGMRR